MGSNLVYSLNDLFNRLLSDCGIDSDSDIDSGM